MGYKFDCDLLDFKHSTRHLTKHVNHYTVRQVLQAAKSQLKWNQTLTFKCLNTLQLRLSSLSRCQVTQETN